MIRADVILNGIVEELKRANIVINDEVKRFVDSYTGPFSYAIKENYRVAEKESLPLCQDTGLVEFFVFLGHEVVLEESISETLQRAVRKVYLESPFRYSVVSDPLFERKNTGDNTP
ncbi:MAG: fumarate hydratase, partial [Thermotogaceae bacterium]|nr:fumarate hydratase [Thermotogaceae bacterium]